MKQYLIDVKKVIMGLNAYMDGLATPLRDSESGRGRGEEIRRTARKEVGYRSD